MHCSLSSSITIISAHVGLNYIIQYVEVPSQSPSVQCLYANPYMHINNHHVQHFRQTYKGRSRQTFSYGYALLILPTFKISQSPNVAMRETLCPSGQMIIDRNECSSTSVHVLTQDWPQTFNMNLIKIMMTISMHMHESPCKIVRVNTLNTGAKAL